jgi:alpha-L-fucosidase
LLINVPVDPQGKLPEADIARLRELHEKVAKVFSRNLAANARITATPAGTQPAAVEVDFDGPVSFNFIELREPIEFGQRIAAYHVDVADGDGWKLLLKGKGVGRRKIERPTETTTNKLRIVIDDARATPVLSAIALYHD